MTYPSGMDTDRLVHLVDHLEAQGRPTTPALRLVHAGRLEAWELPGRSGWWVDPDALEAAMRPDSEDGPSQA